MSYNYFVDTSSWFFIVFLLGTTMFSIVDNTMDWLNSNKSRISAKLKEVYRIHPLMKKFFSLRKVTKSIEYNKENEYFSDFVTSIDSSLTMLFCLCGVAPFFLHSIIRMFPAMSTTSCYIIFFILTRLAKSLIEIPSSAYGTFHIEEKYGFNNATKNLFIIDNIKDFILSVILGSIFITILNYVLTSFGPFSPFKVCLFVLGEILFGFVMEYLYMTVLIRFFNKLTPLENKKLCRKIDRLMKTYGYSAKGVYVMDESKRSNKSNAFIGGIGRSKKIVLFDTLLKNYSDDELLAILGHELAHGKLHHLVLNRINSAVDLLITAFIMFSMTYNIDLYHAFGFRFVTNENIIQYSMIGFFLSSMVIEAIKWIINPLNAYISRKCEYAADRYSVIYTGKKEPMISALIKLTSENCGDLFPNRIYEAYEYDHPSLVNRINAIKEIKTGKRRH